MAKKPSNNNNNRPSNNNNRPSNNNNRPAPATPSRPSSGGGNNNNRPSNNTNNRPVTYTSKAATSSPSTTPRNQTEGPLAPGVTSIPADDRITMEGAMEALTKNSNLRYPDLPENHWRNADYGQTFGGKDIKNWMSIDRKDGGYTNNQIMKIAQAAYAGGQAKNVNKLNKVLGGLNQEWINPNTVTGSQKGQEVTWNYYPWDQKAPKKAFEWNGFGNGMTQYDRQGDIINGMTLGGGYQKGQQWSLPTNLLKGFGPIPGAGTDAGAGAGTGDGAGTGTGTGDTELDPGFGVDPETNPGNVSAAAGGYGDDVASFATSWNSAKGGKRVKNGRQGIVRPGYGGNTKNPLTNANGVGVRTW